MKVHKQFDHIGFHVKVAEMSLRIDDLSSIALALNTQAFAIVM